VTAGLEPVLFDLDGVLVDSRAAITGCLARALQAHGHEVPPVDELERLIGPPLHDAFAELIGAPAESEAVDDCVSAYRECYAVASLIETTVVPGIPEALAELAATGHPLAVATSKAVTHAEPLLAALGLRAHFAVVAGPALGARSESKATTIAAALRALGAPAGRGAMVGDRCFDVAGARAHGLRAIGVTWGIGSARELRDAGADVLVATPRDLAAAV
jgi:phosphoglycolate phosphatase